MSDVTHGTGPRSFSSSLGQLFRARFPILWVETFEEHRVLAEIQSVAMDAKLMRTLRPVWTWSVTTGLVKPDGSRVARTNEPGAALDEIERAEDSGVYVFFDLHSFLGTDQRPADVEIVRRLRDVSSSFQMGEHSRVLMIVSPVLRIPTELEKTITIVDFPLPGEDEIRGSLDSIIEANSGGGRIEVDIDEKGKEKLVKAALGLTLTEAENAYARAMVDDGKLTEDDVSLILEEKRQVIRKSGLLDFVSNDLNLDDVGGLNNLKAWLIKRNNSWLTEAAAYGLPAPKGVMITGVPGCGKSLTAKSVASAWGLPLLRLDIGRVFAGLVGSSEQNLRNALKSAEATAPCVLWIDEIEKGFSSATSSRGDSGTSARVFGTFLSWMQEKTAPVFVIATANNIDSLPPEFLRKGRFDEIFFVDLPTHLERQVIWRLHLAKKAKGELLKLDFAIDDASTATLADASEGYSGAEIEQAVVAAMFESYAGQRPLTIDDLTKAIENMVPLSVTQETEIAAIRAWAATRAVGATSSSDRAGYDVIDRDADGSKKTKGAAAPAPDTARGGRLVDF